MIKMSNKSLWFKEYAQTQSILWVTFILSFFFLPFQVMKRLSEVQEMVNPKGAFTTPELHSIYFNLENPFPLVMAILTISIAAVLIGLERSQGQDDFTLSLPYPRTTIYLTKWAIGATTVLLSIGLNLLIAYLILFFSPFSDYLYVLSGGTRLPVTDAALWFFYGLKLILTGLALFTLALFLGTISGSYYYQYGFSLIFAFFPYGFALLFSYFLEVHGFQVMNGPFQDRLLRNITLFLSILSINLGNPDHSAWLYALVYLLLFLPLGIYFYQKNRVEYNGQMLIFPALQGFFLVGITICFALLGGLIGTGFMGRGSGSTLLFYYISAAAFGYGAYWFSKRLMNRRRRREE